MKPGPNPVRVVLVEDHVLVRDLLSSLIRDELKYVLAGDCTTYREGLAACLRERPTLAIIDWMLPDGRGFDIVREAGPTLARTRWLCISSNEREHLVREAVGLGIHGFVLKSSSLPIFRTAIREVLAGNTYYCPKSAQLYVAAMRNAAAIHEDLTPRELEVLRRKVRGANAKVIAGELGLSTKTVQNTIAIVKEKLRVQEDTALVNEAVRRGFVEPP